MVTTLLLTVVILCIIVFVYRLVQSLNSTDKTVDEVPQLASVIPDKLLDLHTTSVADRQRAYHRSFHKQLQYDELQRQAEALGDTRTLEAIRTDTYEGNLPILRPDGYTHYTSEVYEFDIAGMMYRNLKQVKKCEGLSDARLVAEPTNEFDPNAIKIIHESNTHVGYIPKDQTATVRNLVELPADCFVTITVDDNDEGDIYCTGTVYIEIKK